MSDTVDDVKLFGDIMAREEDVLDLIGVIDEPTGSRKKRSSAMHKNAAKKWPSTIPFVIDYSAPWGK